MRLDEPERLVERAGIGGEDVGGVRVAGVVGLVDRVAGVVGRLPVAVDERRR